MSPTPRLSALAPRLRALALAALADPRLARALHAMHADMANALDVAAVARAAGMSRSAFSNRFRALTGTTPMAYATAWRLLRARQILLTGTAPLIDVAAAVGYASEAAFSRAFRRHYGVSPGALRRADVEPPGDQQTP